MKLGLKFDEVRNCWSCRKDGVLYSLSKRDSAHGTEEIREYMIVSRLGQHKNGWLVSPVDLKEHMLLAHEGFECSGSMCQTLAFAKHDGATVSITPGRVQAIVNVAQNVNLTWNRPIFRGEGKVLCESPGFIADNWTPNPEYVEDGPAAISGWYKFPAEKLQPGKVWVDRKPRSWRMYRTAGLETPPL